MFMKEKHKLKVKSTSGCNLPCSATKSFETKIISKGLVIVIVVFWIISSKTLNLSSTTSAIRSSLSLLK